MCDKTDRLGAEIVGGDRRSVARAITVVEGKGPAAAALIRRIYPHSGKASIIGVTGSPGVGKSTLVDQATTIFRSRQRTVGVLAVDPTSPFSGGAVLGDRLRMQLHAPDPGVFVRSMATRGKLGGIASASSDAAVILDAAGFDVIILETVGVGQAEVEVSSASDMTIVVTMPGAGDGVQALKAGLMETADLFVVNKSDHQGADRSVMEIESMLELREPGPEEWRPPVLQTQATSGEGVIDLVDAIDRFIARTAALERRRRGRAEFRLRQVVSAKLIERAESDALKPGVYDRLIDQVVDTTVDPYTAAEEIVGLVLAASKTAPEIRKKISNVGRG